MVFADLYFIFQWWLLLFLIGFFFLPLTNLIFSSFVDKGYIFSKILGIIIVSYLVFILGVLKIFSFTNLTIMLVVLGLLIFNLFLLFKYPNILISLKRSFKIFFLGEFLFLATLVFWSIIRGYQPDIYGLEKYMDFGFFNSILRSEYFPPKDMWFTNFPINYYYFGHLITAVLTKLSGIPSFVTYNLMVATLFALTFTEAFSIGINLIGLISNTKYRNPKQSQITEIQYSKQKKFRNSIFKKLNLLRASNFEFRFFTGGFLTAFLVAFAGNFHTIYSFFKPYSTSNPLVFWQLLFSPNSFPNSYWYPNATRFIYNTIHEFPLYSFVVSDLHGHVLDIPIVLLTIALLLSLISNQSNKSKNLNFKNSLEIGNWKLEILLIGFLLAVMYMTNVWDGAIYFLLTIFIFITLRLISKIKTYDLILLTLVVLAGFLLFSLPFSLNFKPFASGIGVLCAPDFLTDIGKLGPFLFEKNHCQKSPFWQLIILYGFFYFWVISFFIFLIIKNKTQSAKLKAQNYSSKLKTSNIKLQFLTFNFEFLTVSDILVLLLIILSTVLIIIPEFIYIKDIYPAHYRANTMFKLVYQTFIMSSIASGYIIIRIITNVKSRVGIYLKFIYLFIGSISLFLIGVYPYFGINSYYNNLQNYRGLNGITYLKNLHPSDYEAILWLNKNIKGQPVILEAQGDSYTDFARISANTGLPTVLGWVVHEWLWRGTYDIPAPRIPEIQNLYETSDLNITKRLIKKYNISLIFIGSLEYQKYPYLNEEKFKKIGYVIYKNNLIKIYKVNKDVGELRKVY